MAWKVLFVRAYVVAAIVRSDREAGVLVYDDTESTELVARRAPPLMYKLGLKLYDSSLFPMRADPTDRDACMLRRLLPPCVAEGEESYRHRVLLLVGMDTQKLDAAELAHFLQFEADLVHAAEAVIIHRSEGLVVVVLGSSEDTTRLRQTPEETWIRFFGQKPSCANVYGFGGPDISSEQKKKEQQHQPVMTMGDTAAFQQVRELREGDSDTIALVHCLIRFCALATPECVLRSGFPERCLLLSGVVHGTALFDLSARLSAFGDHHVSLHDLERKALVVFVCWDGAARLLREPQDTWKGLGFLECTRVPGAAEHAGVIVQEVMDQLLQ